MKSFKVMLGLGRMGLERTREYLIDAQDEIEAIHKARIKYRTEALVDNHIIEGSPLTIVLVAKTQQNGGGFIQ